MNKRLDRLEASIKDRPGHNEVDLVDITDEYYRLIDELWGPEPQPGPRPRIRVPRGVLEQLNLCYGDEEAQA